MKRKFIFFSAVSVIGLSGFFVGLNSTPKYEFNELQIANIEALTDDETSNGFEYPTGYPYTSTCNVAIGTGGIFNTVQRCKVVVITCQGGGSGCNSKRCPVHG